MVETTSTRLRALVTATFRRLKPDRFLSIYSPSSSSFNPNFWVGISDLELDFKKKLIVNYNIENEQSYSSVGNYLQDNGIENFLNNSYFFENFIYLDFNYYECYKLLKWR